MLTQNAGKKILYWAANQKSTPENYLKIHGARQAYGDFANRGVHASILIIGKSFSLK